MIIILQVFFWVTYFLISINAIMQLYRVGHRLIHQWKKQRNESKLT